MCHLNIPKVILLPTFIAFIDRDDPRIIPMVNGTDFCTVQNQHILYFNTSASWIPHWDSTIEHILLVEPVNVEPVDEKNVSICGSMQFKPLLFKCPPCPHWAHTHLCVSICLSVCFMMVSRNWVHSLLKIEPGPPAYKVCVQFIELSL